MTDYRVRRKLHPQGGSYLVAIPKLWVEAKGLDRDDAEVDCVFNDEQLLIEPVDPRKPARSRG